MTSYIRWWVSSTRGRVSSTVCVPDVCRLLFLGNFPYGELWPRNREHSAAMPRARSSREQPPSTAARSASFIASVAQAPPRERRIASVAGAAAGIAAARQCSASAARHGAGGPDGTPIISLCGSAAA